MGLIVSSLLNSFIGPLGSAFQGKHWVLEDYLKARF